MIEGSKTKWKFYLNSEEAWNAMLGAISNASLSIDLEQYIFLPDEIGKRFIELLKEKCKQGVKIRILCDEVGSFSFSGSKEAREMIALGIDLRFFNSIVPWKPYRETFWYFRDHRKLMVIDSKIGFTGSVCLSDDMKDWRESHVEIQGPVIKQMEEAFNVMWNKRYRKFRYIFHRKKTKNHYDLDNFYYITNAPLPRKRFIYYNLIKAIRSAKKYIYLTTPYFLPNYRLLKALKESAKRGVEVKLLLPRQTDSLIADIGSQTFFTEILKQGVSVYRFNQMIHSKTITIDDEWSTIGSLNLDNVSLRYNFEANLISTNTLFTKEIKTQFENDLLNASKLDLETWKRRSIFNKLIELIVWPFRKLL